MNAKEYEHRQRDWSELSRRLKQLQDLQGDSAEVQELDNDLRLHSINIPANDPTGVVELAETMRSQQIEKGLQLERDFPHSESFFCPLVPWGEQGKRYPEVSEKLDQLLVAAKKWVTANLVKGEDYEVFSCVAGEVTTFHFCTAEQKRDFLIAIGLDPEKGFARGDCLLED